MSGNHVFISHASKDDAFVKELREALESLVWQLGLTHVN